MHLRSTRARITPRIGKIHPWLVVCKFDFCLELFKVLDHNVLGVTNYGLEVTEKSSSSVIISFHDKIRLERLFDKFGDKKDDNERLFSKIYQRGKVSAIIGEHKLWFFLYDRSKEELTVKLKYGFWNKKGMPQHA